MRLFFASSAALLVTALSASALADVAPPAGYEEQCTLQKQSSPTTECYSCSAFYGNADHCPKSLADYEFTQKCRARGASVWSEVWCRPKSANAPVVPVGILAQLGDAQSKPGPAASVVAAPSARPGRDEAPKDPPPAPPPKKSCAIAAPASLGSSLGIAGVLVVLGALRRRSRLRA